MNATLAKFVDFPTPLTPINTTTYGLCSSLALATSAIRSICLFGVNILTSASRTAVLTVVSTDVKLFVFV